MILGHLVSHPDGVTATRLRQWIGITAAGMSTALTDLERDGLDRAHANPHDARSLLFTCRAGYRRT
jgi:DNA-binding MarR family transcriptional regulator